MSSLHARIPGIEDSHSEWIKFRGAGHDGTQPSNEVVAGLLGVAEGTIRNYREQLEADGRLKVAEKVLGKDGKIQTAKRTTKKKPSIVPQIAAEPGLEGATAPVSRSSQSASIPPSTQRLLNPNLNELEKALNPPSPASAPVNQPGNSDEREILQCAIEILNGLDAHVWQKCDDREELASLVSELVKSGNAALKANGAVKTKEKAA